MKPAIDPGAAEPVSEMAIVDTFTKLIFIAYDSLSAREELIIQSLRTVDPRVALDDYRGMGEYLRALGVAEMIELVSAVQTNLSAALQAPMTAPAELAPRRRAS
ncbi:MAG: hypothetical protein V2I26_12880 [Halieaceae bacterium]|jgi:hypothetical protein|nr:hypothetical protein [Halieaceae bacterium]